MANRVIAGKKMEGKKKMGSSAIASEGTLRIHRSIAGTSAPFRVTYQPYQDGDEPAPAAERAFYYLQDVRAFLNLLGVGAEFVKEALRELTAGRSAFLTNIALTEKAIKNAGFGSLVAARG
ncbi:MAG TPA: hypothetical protein VGF19_04330 [Candidatus Acidoferrum sp.]